MTAEVAIFNKSAVALAADSAVTISSQKVYNSANKVFSLSKHHPIGIMIYGNAEFMGVPWETTIKWYRQELGARSFKTLRTQAEDFIKFLEKTNLFRPQIQDEYLTFSVFSYFKEIKKEIIKLAGEYTSTEGSISDSDTRFLVRHTINEHYQDLDNDKDLKHLPDTFAANFIRRHKKAIKKIADEVFEKLPLDAASIRKLHRIAAYLFSKSVFPNDTSGVVVAGFGRGDVFPSSVTYELECKVDGFLKYSEISRKSTVITEDNSASITAFAQTEMVYTFMQGTDPFLARISGEFLEEVFKLYPEVIVEELGIKNSKEGKRLRKSLKQKSQELYRSYNEMVERYQREKHVHPILTMVQVLPKDELAVMAETLVNLTSFKRRVTEGMETVGGPIDVAVISKGDGFVWIKRKHYFEAPLNHQFFENYYGSSKHGKA